MAENHKINFKQVIGTKSGITPKSSNQKNHSIDTSNSSNSTSNNKSKKEIKT